MAADAEQLPEFKKPPVIEVVCGTLFKQLSSLHAVQLGSFWEKLKPEYDHSREVAPLAPAIEQFDEPKPLEIQLSDVPPLARTWLLTPKENGIVQLQRDRFLHNWKKVEPQNEYPRYKQVIQMFKERLHAFEEFLDEAGLGTIEPTQYEITYINHIPQGEGWQSTEDIGSVFPDFTHRKEPGRFLAKPDHVNWRTSFDLPDKQGRLHAVVRTALRATDKTPMLLFELTTRGMPGDKSREAMWTWFDLGHRWIVKGFEDLTSKAVRKNIWKQTR